MSFSLNWDYYGNHLLEIPFVWQGGMAIQGGVVLGTIAAIGIFVKTRLTFGLLPIYLPLH